MPVTTLGTGSPIPDPQRAGPSTLVQAGSTTDLNDVITTHWVMSREPTPLRIYGPPRTAEVLDGIFAMLAAVVLPPVSMPSHR